VSKQGLVLAFQCCDFSGTGRINYIEFVAMVYGPAPTMSIVIDPVQYSPNVATEKLFAAYRREIAEKSVTRDTLQPHPPAPAKLSQGRKLDSDGWMQEVTRDAEGARHSFAVTFMPINIYFASCSD